MKLGSVRQATSSAQEPNVAPLIDIVFILLIFFVVTTTFSRELGIEVDTPQASTGAQISTPVVRVAVGPRHELAVEGRATSPWRLEAEVRDRLSHATEKSVLLVADASVDAATLVQVMDTCRKAGAVHVALGVESEP